VCARSARTTALAAFGVQMVEDSMPLMRKLFGLATGIVGPVERPEPWEMEAHNVAADWRRERGLMLEEEP
jgi:hypothetical protein